MKSATLPQIKKISARAAASSFKEPVTQGKKTIIPHTGSGYSHSHLPITHDELQPAHNDTATHSLLTVAQKNPVAIDSQPPVQLISDFSAWFIKTILLPLLLEILKKDEKAPKGFDKLIKEIGGFLEINDTGQPEWQTAVVAIQHLFQQMGNELPAIVLGSIIIDRLDEALQKEGFSATSQEKIRNYLAVLRTHMLKQLPDESDLSEGEDETPTDMETLFEYYPNITGPLRRPGHLNPYRHGIGAADTIAIVVRDRLDLASRQQGIDRRHLESLEAMFQDLDQQIKAINDKQEKPILQEMARLIRERNALEDKAKGKKVDTTKIDALLEEQETRLLEIRNGKKKQLREQLRELYEEVFWISQKNEEDVDKEARARQEKDFMGLSKEKGFEDSFRLVDEDPEEYFSVKEGITPSLTQHHSEQRAIVSKYWLGIRKEVLESVGDELLDYKGEKNLKAIARFIPQIITTMSLNRSSCNTCNAFLVLELISLWKEIAGMIGGVSWQDVRDAFRSVFVFELTYSVPYSKVKHPGKLNKQLTGAGWIVYQHEQTEASDDEGEHEKLSLGNIVSSETKKKQKRKKGAKSESDSDYSGSENEKEELDEQTLLFITRLTNRMATRLKLELALQKFFLRLVKKEGANSAIEILTQLGFTHNTMAGTNLDCALYSIQHQLKKRHGIKITDFTEFSAYVRSIANLNFNRMIDVLNNGQALLNAVVKYLLEKGIIKSRIRLSLKVWSAVAGEGVMEFDNVASSTGGGPYRQLTLFYDGIGHFDSLTGGPDL